MKLRRGKDLSENLDKSIAGLTNKIVSLGFEEARSSRIVWRILVGDGLEGLVNEDRLNRWFDVSGSSVNSLRHLFEGVKPAASELFTAFERGSSLRMARNARRDSGLYYTPYGLAEFSISEVVAAMRTSGRRARDWRLVDPSCGSGVFAAAAIAEISRVIAEQESIELSVARNVALSRSMYLVDADPLAVAVARCLLIAEFASVGLDLDSLELHMIPGDAVVGGPGSGVRHGVECGVQWRDEFPEVFVDGGFDAVIGNPPWGVIKPSLREFASELDPSLLRLERGRMRTAIEEMSGDLQKQIAYSRRAYARALRSAGFEFQGSGESDFYRYFVELAYSLVRPGGVVGMLVPSAFQRSLGAAPLRAELLEQGSFDLLADFVNSEGIFPIHKMFRFSLFVWVQGGQPGVRRLVSAVRNVEAGRAAVSRPIVGLSLEYLREVSPTRLAVPDVRAEREAELYRRLHLSFAPLGDRSAGEWQVRFRREVDMTNDVSSFLTAERVEAESGHPLASGLWWHPSLGRLLPVYEGRMVNQFDSAAKAHVEGHGRSARWETLPPSLKRIQSRYLIPEREAIRRGISCERRSGFCDVTGHANERTVLASVIPGEAVCGNKVPVCDFSLDSADLPYLWVSIANSFVIDWIVRRRVSTTLNFFHWEEVPFPRVGVESTVGKRLVEASRTLMDAKGMGWRLPLGARATVRAEIDVEVALLFDLDCSDVLLILNDFPLLDRGVPEAHRTVTRDLFLYRLAVRRGFPQLGLSDLGIKSIAGPDMLAERVGWHDSAGAIAYVPGELARAL